MSFISKLFGGNKSEKDVRIVRPLVSEINKYFESYQSLSNDDLRSKTQEFRQRIKDYLAETDQEIVNKNQEAENLVFNDLNGRDALYQQVDKLKKKRDDQIEEILNKILPEAFAVVKETARRFK